MYIHLGLGAQGTVAVAQDIVAGVSHPGGGGPLAAQERTLAGDHLRCPARFVPRGVTHQAHVSVALATGDVHRIPNGECIELVPSRGFLASAYDVGSDEVLVEDQKLRDEDCTVAAELGDPADPSGGHPLCC